MIFHKNLKVRAPLADVSTGLSPSLQNPGYPTRIQAVCRRVAERETARYHAPRNPTLFIEGPRKLILGLLVAALVILTWNTGLHAVENITVDATQVKFTRAKNGTGLLVSSLLDLSNPKPAIPYTSAIRQSSVGWLRFPEGGMSKNYLWHTPGDYANAVNGLKPQVASLSVAPGTAQFSGYRLAANSPVFNSIPMNFDQFIKVCQDTGVEPIVGVSASAYKYPNTTVTESDLLTNAVEWVRYANVTRGYHVKYWQIGNEEDAAGGALLTQAEYVNILTNFSAAMKAVDPTIKIGAGVSFQSSWMTYVLANALASIDFMTPHAFGSPIIDSYSTYQADTGTYLASVSTALQTISTAVPQPQQSRIQILVTAMNGGHDGNADGTSNQANVIYRALANFEQMANILTQDSRIISSDMWAIHNPFANDPSVVTDSDAFDLDNNLTPVGGAVQALAQFLKPTILNVTRVSGYLRSYAAWNPNDSSLAVWIVNKDANANSANLTLTNFNRIGSFDKWVFTGSSPDATNYSWQVSGGSYATNPLVVALSPYSITVLHFHPNSVTIAPVVSAQSQSQTATVGATVSFNVTATGTPAPTYQWQFNGAPIAGATTATLTLANVQAAAAGDYSVVVSNAAGSVTSFVATLDILGSSRISNLSILTNLTAASPLLTVGTVIGGAGTSGNKPLLIRAAGPSLTPLGVPGTCPDPMLDLFSGQTLIGTNDNWGGTTTLKAAFANVGAFAYTSDASKDAAIYNDSQPAGSYTMQVSGVNGATGAVITEIYDGTPVNAATTTVPRLINVSVLKSISVGEVLTAGFVISGTTAKTVLIRAVGPTLGVAPFNIAGVMADPKLDLFSGQTVINSNNDWGGSASFSNAFASVGAFALSNALSKDAVILATLMPGNYTAQVTGFNGSAGLVLVEVYEVP